MSHNEAELCSAALIKLGAGTIHSFDEDTAESRCARRLYPLVRDALLCSHPWSFATEIIEADVGERLPDDVLKVPGKGLVVGREWQVPGSALCIVRVPERDLPAYFINALIARLAAEFCLPLTENTARADRLARLAEEELKLAKLIDSQQDMPPRSAP